MRVLSVTHGPSVPGGVFEEVVEALGPRARALDRCPTARRPGRARSFDAVMAFGGSMHPDQDERFGWLESEEEFLKDVLAGGVPVVGVCLGAQMLARAAGAWIGPAREDGDRLARGRAHPRRARTTRCSARCRRGSTRSSGTTTPSGSPQGGIELATERRLHAGVPCRARAGGSSSTPR